MTQPSKDILGDVLSHASTVELLHSSCQPVRTKPDRGEGRFRLDALDSSPVRAKFQKCSGST